LPGFDENFMKHGRNLIAVTLAVAALALTATDASAQARFQVQFAPQVRAEPFSGRVYVFFSRGAEPRRGPDWFKPAPLLAIDVENLPPGQPVDLSLSSTDQRSPLAPESGRKTLAFPAALDFRSLAGMKAQAVVRFNPLEREVGTGPGNGFSAVAVVPTTDEPMKFVVDSIVPKTEVVDTEWTKVLRVPSKLSSEFHSRPVELAAAVQLPPSYLTSPGRRYPVVFEVPGFGGSLRHGVSNKPYAPATSGGVEFIHVFLDPNCPLGHRTPPTTGRSGRL